MKVQPMIAADPETLVRQRVEAFRRRDFGFIYDSYHPEALFRQQFPDRDGYLRYAKEEIASQMRIERFRILKARQRQERAEVIFHQLLMTASGAQESFEMALLERIGGRWLYLGSQRMDRAMFQGRPEELGFADFETAPERIFF
ncbi:hypothetical protein EDC39_102111 [Geothermobacter ehrlichii]|uniref:YchJ-like middle NTF2-like domain-containing protein n=1 Tax=Geothermobacter ehrlichii TaxID=213224 RepID=A0A5D3WND7_9BACT|nr:YchJ family metal-binding protein [Geothermobacter ehrlichii]TYO99588.1 hypothetical protein EDC39_102111 [Geothermobacter ehrlichii]